MNKKLLHILVCPVCKGKLDLKGGLFKKGEVRLECARDGLVFPVIDGIPMLNQYDAVKKGSK